MSVRAVRWPEDEPHLASIDRSFESDEVARVTYDGRFVLAYVRATPVYSRTEEPIDLDGLRASDDVFVAESDGHVVGYIVLRCERWNRRGVITDLYVDRAYRGRGIGRALIDVIDSAARGAGMNRMWVETQDVNAPALRFYLAAGFVLGGLDTTLYDPATPAGREIALYLTRSLH